LECKKAMGQIVMTIFYGVDPSDVRKQIGKFGIAFNETCARKTEEERQKWSKALNEVSNIAGEDFLRWLVFILISDLLFVYRFFYIKL